MNALGTQVKAYILIHSMEMRVRYSHVFINSVMSSIATG